MATITVDLIARTAAFQTEMQKASKTLDDLKKSTKGVGIAGQLFTAEKVSQGIVGALQASRAIMRAFKGDWEGVDSIARSISFMGFGGMYSEFRAIRAEFDGTAEAMKRMEESWKRQAEYAAQLKSAFEFAKDTAGFVRGNERIVRDLNTASDFEKQRNAALDVPEDLRYKWAEVMNALPAGTGETVKATLNKHWGDRIASAHKTALEKVKVIDRAEEMDRAQRQQRAAKEMQEQAEKFATEQERAYKASPAYQVEQFLQDLQDQVDFFGKSANEIARIKIERDVGMTPAEKEKALALMGQIEFLEPSKTKENDTGSVQQLSRNQFYGLNGGESVGLQRQTVAELKQVNRSLRNRAVSAGLSGG